MVSGKSTIVLRGILLIIFIESISFCHGYYADIPIPAPLKNRHDANPVSRADRMEKNMRLLTILNLMQQKWELYGDFWYKLFEVELMWIPAENFCRELGGHLVSIKDIAENDFVHKLRKKNNIWIGLNKVNSKSDIYNWSDGSTASFLNWDSTQPNEPEVDCVYMAFNQEKTGTWFDYACSEKLPQYFVCKMQI